MSPFRGYDYKYEISPYEISHLVRIRNITLRTNTVVKYRQDYDVMLLRETRISKALNFRANYAVICLRGKI